MTVEELAVEMNRRFDTLDDQIKGLYSSKDEFAKECRTRHTEIDKNIAAGNVKSSVGNVVAVALASAIAGLVTWIKG